MLTGVGSYCLNKQSGQHNTLFVLLIKIHTKHTILRYNVIFFGNWPYII